MGFSATSLSSNFTLSKEQERKLVSNYVSRTSSYILRWLQMATAVRQWKNVTSFKDKRLTWTKWLIWYHLWPTFKWLILSIEHLLCPKHFLYIFSKQHHEAGIFHLKQITKLQLRQASCPRSIPKNSRNGTQTSVSLTLQSPHSITLPTPNSDNAKYPLCVQMWTAFLNEILLLFCLNLGKYWTIYVLKANDSHRKIPSHFVIINSMSTWLGHGAPRYLVQYCPGCVWEGVCGWD